jgi:hypothetical protein
MSHLPLVHVFHMIPLWAIRGCGIHHRRNGKVSSDSVTTSAIKFTGPHKSSMCQYHSMLAHQGLDDVVFNLHMQGLPSSELQIDNKQLSAIPI